jgi:hypothetical protein
MDEFLRKIELLDNFTVELEVDRNVFVDRLMSIVDPGSTETIFTLFEGFGSNGMEYKGKVDNEGFEIRRRKKLFDSNINLAIAKGKWRQREDHLIVNTEVKSFNNFFIFFIIMAIVFYGFAFVAIFLSENGTEESSLWMAISIPFLFVHAAFMLGIPSFIMRRSINRMKYDLTREFHYLAATKNSSHS